MLSQIATVTFNYGECHFSMTNYYLIGKELKRQETCGFFFRKSFSDRSLWNRSTAKTVTHANSIRRNWI